MTTLKPQITDTFLMEKLDSLIDDLEEFHLNYAEGLFDSSPGNLVKTLAHYRQWSLEIKNFARQHFSATAGEEESVRKKLERVSFLISSLP